MNTPPPSSGPDSDDPSLVLRYCREHLQRRLSEIARLAGVVSAPAIEAFSLEIGAAHDELASASPPDSFNLTAGLTASRISLVHNDELELEIRIGDIINRVKDNDRIDHWRVQLRYMTLLKRPQMTPQNNPLGVEPIRRGLWSLCRTSSLSSDEQLALLERVEEQLQFRLPEVYTELNGLLEHHRVEPAVAQIIRRQGSRGDETVAPSPAALPPPNALFSLQQALRHQSGEATLPPPPVSAPVAGNSIVTAQSALLSASAMVMLKHLTERIDALEKHQASSPADAPNGAAEDRPLQTLKAKDLDLPLGKPVSIALDTLSFIFEAIFATPDIPDAVKAAIGRLQIPLFKVSILDPTFFSDTQHPARRLVNRMARAAIGLPSDAGREHPTCAKLAKVADGVRSTFESDDGDLTPLLDEIDTLISEHDAYVEAGAQPYIRLVIDFEARESARTGADAWLTKTLARTAEPALVQFLSEHWRLVMQAACLDGGTSGAAWKENEATVNELLWSVQPKENVEQRKRCAALIPALIQRINAALDGIAVPADRRVPFFNACFALQTAALRGGGAAAPAAAAPRPPSFSGQAALPASQLLQIDGKIVQYVGQPTDQTVWRTRTLPWAAGDWISFHLPDGERLCGRLSWQGAAYGTLLFYNRSWGYAVAMAPTLLDRQISRGEALVVSEISLFDEAAKTALGQIKPA